MHQITLELYYIFLREAPWPVRICWRGRVHANVFKFIMTANAVCAKTDWAKTEVVDSINHRMSWDLGWLKILNYNNSDECQMNFSIHCLIFQWSWLYLWLKLSLIIGSFNVSPQTDQTYAVRTGSENISITFQLQMTDRIKNQPIVDEYKP